MSQFDFENSKLPSLLPLEESFTQNDFETEIRDLTCALFESMLAEDVFDSNVTGARHLGTYDLVKKAINTDGLVLLRGDREEEATRYVYRAWMARNAQGRGMHFVRTYLQVLFPNQCFVEQLWHKKDVDYPNGTISTRDGVDVEINPETAYLTSRIEIAVDLGLVNRSVTQFTNTIRSVIPARLVPQFRFCIVFDVTFEYDTGSSLYMNKEIEGWMPWCGLVVTERPSRLWQLGKDGDTDAPKLKSCRATGVVGIDSSYVISYADIHKIGEEGLKVDGSWQVFTHRPLSAEGYVGMETAYSVDSDFAVDGASSLTSVETINYPRVTRIGQEGLKVDGTWKIPAYSYMSAGFDMEVTTTN